LVEYVAAVIYLDTYVVVWLYAGLTARLSQAVLDLLNSSDLAISPMVLLELQYLYETGRTTEPGSVVVQDLSQRISLQVSEEAFQHVIVFAVQQTWTCDPFDRIIVGQAALRQTTLVTKDRTMHQHYPHAFWS
jgi:PIN domain nuclease of toxin-antitoxin system